MNILAPHDPALLAEIQKQPMASIHLLNQGGHHPPLDTWKELAQYMKSNLGEHFAPILGEGHGKVPGKYRKSQLYVFEFEQHHFLCSIEKGNRGTSWYWVLANPAHHHFQHRVLYLDSEPLCEVFPDFLRELHRQVFGRELPLDAFDPAIQLRIQSQEQHDLLHVTLTDDLPTRVLPPKKI